MHVVWLVNGTILKLTLLSLVYTFYPFLKLGYINLLPDNLFNLGKEYFMISNDKK